MDTSFAIQVTNVSKTFKLPHEKHSGIKQAIISTFNKKSAKGFENQNVLKNVSFEVKKGEFFGIVGRNGSGKSTLLKLISNIYVPDKGRVKISGSLTPFIELGVGFNPELTGRENVFLNGALLGFSRKDMEEKYNDIVTFAELENFMDQKLKNYSSGMQVRLAFSIAIQADSDVLILDEVLAVGDASFQRKCFKYFADIKQQNKTVILVTHSMDSVQKFCDRAMLIEGGEIVSIGSPVDIANDYLNLFKIDTDNITERITENDRFDISAKVKKANNKINLHFSLKPKMTFENPVVGMVINQIGGKNIWRWASDDKTPINKGLNLDLKKDQISHIKISLENILPDSSYSVRLLVRKSDKSEEYASFPDIVRFDNYHSSLYDQFWKIQSSVEVSYKDKL